MNLSLLWVPLVPCTLIRALTTPFETGMSESAPEVYGDFAQGNRSPIYLLLLPTEGKHGKIKDWHDPDCCFDCLLPCTGNDSVGLDPFPTISWGTTSSLVNWVLSNSYCAGLLGG